MKYYLGIDLGGTNIVAGVVDENHQILSKSKTPTHLARTMDEIVADMAAMARKALEEAGLCETDIPYVGLGVPSSINPQSKHVVFANNLGWKDADVCGTFQTHWDIPVHIANDADSAALGEALAGAAKDYDNILMITLGTGVGGGLVLDKKLFRGGDGFCIEPGHTVLVHNGFPCTCGKLGCLESYASVTGLVRETIDAMTVYPHSLMWEECGNDLNRVSGRTSFNAAKRGDAPALAVVEQYIEYLGSGLASMTTMLRPQAIIIGGGLSNEGDYLIEPLRKVVNERMYATGLLAPPAIIKAVLGNDAGIIGAALLEE